MLERRKFFAFILVLLGVLFFLSNFIAIFQLQIIWPIILIILGLGLMFKEFNWE